MALLRMSSISMEVSLVRSVGLYLSSSFSRYWPDPLPSLDLSPESDFCKTFSRKIYRVTRQVDYQGWDF